MRILLPTLHVRRSPQSIPLATGCLKACLPEQFRSNTQLLDLFPDQSDSEFLQLILAHRPQLIAFSLYLWNRSRILKLCKKLRHQHPELILLAGGPEASADGVNVIVEGGLDGVICGEGEAVLPLLLAALTAENSTTEIPGFLSAENLDNHCNPAVCHDLTSLPSPWLQGDLSLQTGDGVLWEVARGCRFNCAFCYDAKGQQGVRPLPLKRLAAELELFVAKQVSQIWILDSTFNSPPERGKQLLQLLIDQAPQIHFHLEAKADFLDQQTAELLSQLSCSVQIGLQSADPQVLKPLHRAVDHRQMEKRLQQLGLSGVTFGLDLIYGLPGDNHLGFKQSLDFALRQQPNQVDIFPLAVLPGTELFQRQQEFGISADRQPPYLIEQNDSYSQSDLQASQQLAAATDIFYNRGRAVGVFMQFCTALKITPSRLLEKFADWLPNETKLGKQGLSEVDQWQPEQILPLQQRFITAQLRAAKKTQLIPLANDLLNYHFLCAETLLAEDCQPAETLPAKKQRTHNRWQLNPQVQIEKFHHDLEGLEMFGGEALTTIIKQLPAEICYGIFLRREGEILIEALQADFAKMLLSAKNGKSGAQLLQGIAPAEQDELLNFAIAEGLLRQII